MSHGKKPLKTLLQHTSNGKNTRRVFVLVTIPSKTRLQPCIWSWYNANAAQWSSSSRTNEQKFLFFCYLPSNTQPFFIPFNAALFSYTHRHARNRIYTHSTLCSHSIVRRGNEWVRFFSVCARTYGRTDTGPSSQSFLNTRDRKEQTKKEQKGNKICQRVLFFAWTQKM